MKSKTEGVTSADFKLELQKERPMKKEEMKYAFPSNILETR